MLPCCTSDLNRRDQKIMSRSLPKEPLFTNKKRLKQAREDEQAHPPGKRS
jgi:hypothetical protein